MEKQKIRVCDYIAKFIVEQGVRDVFLVSGGGMMYNLDGLVCNGEINVVCAHNEAAAAVMAEGYARVAENLGVLMVTTGPGGTNAVTGVTDAWVDSIPMLVISGQCKRSQNVRNSAIDGLRSLGGQEVDILPIVRSFTKYSEMVNDPNMIRYHLEKAVYLAREGRPGPSWLDVPLDVQSAHIIEEDLEPFVPNTPKADNALLNRQVRDTYELLKNARRPVFIAGHGIRLSGSEGRFLQLVGKARIPVVASKLGQDLIDHDHPYYAGFGGTKGTRNGNLAMQNADLVISIGSRLAIPFIGYEYELFARDAKKVAVDIDRRELIKRTIQLDIAINADAGEFIDRLSRLLEESPLPERTDWVGKCRHWKEKYGRVEEAAKRQESPICSYNLFDRFSTLLDDKAILIADAGTVYCILSQAFRIKHGQRAITPACLGTMGLSLPLAIGAYYAAPNQTIIAVTGDGSLQMNIQELQTIVHNRIPIKLFVVNNNGYVSIRNSQDAYFKGRYLGSSPDSGVSCPDLAKISWAYGIRYESMRTQQEMDAKLGDVLKFDGPIICEVFTDTAQKIMPSVSSKELPDGRLVSMPLEDMWPYLPREEFKEEMLIDPLDCSKMP
ncbi:MAG TPA: thiamine pyrophosphate-binding protein [Methanocella sp.]|nr:thiamine pyrophosphate-binding protein [Methanocella sp.]